MTLFKIIALNTLALSLSVSVVSFSHAEKKQLNVQNNTDQQVATMVIENDEAHVEGQPQTDGKKKQKKLLALGLAPSPDGANASGKGKNERDGKEKRKSFKAVEVDVSEENCLADVSFVLADGKVIIAPRMDLCGLDAIIVETEDNVPVISEPAITNAATPPAQ
jgi:hypothetical protein